MKRSYLIPRRSFLQGVGACIALPALEIMRPAVAVAKSNSATEIPLRLGVFHKGNGIDPAGWQANGTETDFTLSKNLQPLEPFKDDIVILSNVSNQPKGDHYGAMPLFMTGIQNRNPGQTFDQVIADHNSDQTRFSSLVLSTDGGVGEPTRSSTLSYDRRGRPIPSQHRPRLVYEQLFGASTESLDAQQAELRRTQSMLDRVLEHSRSVRRKLGKQDQRKFDEYLASVRQIEESVERSRRWLEVPKPQVDEVGLSLDADDTTPRELIQTMFDLMFLAFQTDSTRVATYQLGNMNGATSIAGKFPQLVGIGKTMHQLAHGAGKGQGGKELGQWHQFLTDQTARFLMRLKETQEGDGTLLDHTVMLYGSSNSQTHRNANYPLALAGGSALNLQHGRLLKLNDSTPMSNVFVTVLNRMGIQTDAFADSTGELPELSSV